MNALRKWTPLAVFSVFLTAGLFVGSDGREVTATSFGESPDGYRAVFELLRRMTPSVERNFSDPASLPPRTVWLIEPPRICRSDSFPASMDEYQADGAFGHWIARGGTAVIFVSASSIDSCGELGGVVLPLLEPLECETGDSASESEPDLAGSYNIAGDLAAKTRLVKAVGLRQFVPADGWRVRMEAAGKPFVVEHALGDGRIVLVADAQILRNRWLDKRDAPVLAVDLARAYGEPLFDEWTHGFRDHQNLPLYLLASSALPVLLGVVLLGLTTAWYGAVVPVRSGQEQAEPPSLDESVNILAAAYAATADFPALHERYRHYAAARLRHHLHLPPDADAELIERALARRRKVAHTDARALLESNDVRKREDLIARMRALDRLILEAIG